MKSSYLLSICFIICGTVSFITAKAEDCTDLVPYGVPTTFEKTTQLCRTAYLVRYYNQCKDPLYVAEHLQAKNVGGTEPRRSFMADQEVPKADRAELSDYLHSGYDRGHMAPAGDFKSDAKEMDESFFLSNMVPQTKNLNRVTWKEIEMRTRALASKLGDVYVFTGGIFPDTPKKIGNGVCVPSYTFKVLIDKKTSQGIAFLAENKTSGFSKKISDYEAPIFVIEHETGINFTPALNDDVLEAKIKREIGQEMTVSNK